MDYLRNMHPVTSAQKIERTTLLHESGKVSGLQAEQNISVQIKEVQRTRYSSVDFIVSNGGIKHCIDSSRRACQPLHIQERFVVCAGKMQS